MQSLNNQRVLVVGGTSGIGFATAVAAIGAGAIVTIASRNQKNLDTAAANLGSGVQMRALDTGDNNLLERFFQQEQAWDHVVVGSQTKGGPVPDF
jgi:NAD(P)-dependent dehydrogenase (short-subunit alcohol dehydrogenase family)